MFSQLISQALNIPVKQVEATLNLLDDGCTIPFISRYRKEATGGLDEVQIADIAEQQAKFQELAARKETIVRTIEEQGKMTDDLRKRIDETWSSTELEDIYLPYRPKRRTRAQVAREKGLEPLALFLLGQAQMPRSDMPVNAQVGQYVDAEKGVATTEDALQGAQDIIAEMVAENEEARNTVRRNYEHDAVIESKVVKGKEQEGQNFRDYFDWHERLSRCASHRLLAMRRGEAEGILRLSIAGNEQYCMDRLHRQFVHNGSQAGHLVSDAVVDGYKRLLQPSIATEYAQSSKETADREAIRIFVRNLEQLLMSAPLGQKRVLALDPGFRTGCKVVCLDAEGNLLHHDVIFPHPPKSAFVEAMRIMEDLVKRFQIEAISIGNGTASRETEEFVQGLGLGLPIFVVSEDGASIYSASKVAREEFPDQDVTVRGAVSIGRRLMDPLAELVKIEPDSIGVGQYQKDVNQTELRHSLDLTVQSCVNKVGVNVNTASKHLLTYISGLGPLLAQNIVDYRAEHGAFHSREELKQVNRMGPKAFQQSAGFLRVSGSDNPLDNSAVHPESYWVVEQIAADNGCAVSDLIGDKGEARREAIDWSAYVSDRVGAETLADIRTELAKPGRDPRQQLEEFRFSDEVKQLEDVVAGMVLPGIVTNITNFGAFVDVGVHTKGLVHVSEMSDHFVKDPNSILSLHQHVRVRVKEVDLDRHRLALSLKGVE
ncbi:MAG: RNA-binding transcriptional accessory protein [Bacteroidales bacterium]|nr:RNA-binding transcriptional accessory protein [Bacteroidales bacterium]